MELAQKVELRQKVAAHHMDDSRNLPATKTIKRYLICSSERSGSTLLADLLDQTGKAGRPLEYFNPVYIEAYCINTKTIELHRNTYWLALQEMRTTPNGVFGVKAHLPQIIEWLGEDSLEETVRFLAGFDHLIFIRRRDKIGQAISFYRASVTGHWSSQHTKLDLQTAKVPVFDGLRISSAYRYLMNAEENWRKVFSKLNRQPIEIDYEDLASEPRQTILRVLNAIGIESGSDEFSTSTISRQGDGLNDKFRADFLDYMRSHS